MTDDQNPKQPGSKRATTAQTMLIASIGCGFLALMAMNPAGQFFMVIIATLFAIAGALFATRNPVRLFGAGLTAILLVAAFSTYPEYRNDMDTWKKKLEKSRQKSTQAKPQPPDR